MCDDLLDKIKNVQPVSSDDVKKSTEGLKSLNEGFVNKNFSLETSTDNSKTPSEDD